MTPERTTDNQRRAYTLIELLIVVALLGLAAALLIPFLVDRDDLEAQAAVRMVIGDISFAQADALAHQEFRRVHFYDDGSGYCITRVTQAEVGNAFDAGSADYVIDTFANVAGAPFVKDFIASEDFAEVSIIDVDVDGGARDIYFDPLGGTIMAGNAPGLGGFVQLGSADDTYQIDITPFTGKLTVQKIVP